MGSWDPVGQKSRTLHHKLGPNIPEPKPKNRMLNVILDPDRHT